MKNMVGNIGNAYLEAKTKEKVYFIVGPEFGPLQGHTLIIVKALYGLRTSGVHFHDKLVTTLMEDGWKPFWLIPTSGIMMQVIAMSISVFMLMIYFSFHIIRNNFLKIYVLNMVIS